MRTYSFGTETVPVALAGDLLIGSVHDGRNYRIMLARLEGEEIAETRFLSGRTAGRATVGLSSTTAIPSAGLSREPRHRTAARAGRPTWRGSMGA